MHIRRLAKTDVRLVSITQELSDDSAQVRMRQVIALFDEYQSRENAKYVLRAMKENARHGFYNGSPVPLGYRTIEVQRRGNKAKKRLEIDPVEAETIRFIFRLYHSGDGKSGPLGTKEIAKRLNAMGERTKRGARFGVGTLHGILTNRKRIYTMVEDGVAEMDDILRIRIASLKVDRERIQASLDRARTNAVPIADIPPALVEEFGRMMRENIAAGDIPFRKAYIQAVDQVGDK